MALKTPATIPPPSLPAQNVAMSHQQFLDLYSANEIEKDLLPERLEDLVAARNYATIETSLMIHLDALDGIISSLDVGKPYEKYPTGTAFVRDTSRSLPLADRLSPEDPRILADNMLLRALNTMRAIDHVLQHKQRSEKHPLFQETSTELQSKFQALLTATMSNNEEFKTAAAKISDPEELKTLHKSFNGYLEDLQKSFNTQLILILHKTNLDAGLDPEEPKQYATLLGHYRNLANTLNPAKSLVTQHEQTIINDKGVKAIVTRTDSSHPVTEKTAVQQEQLKVLKQKSSSKNFHSGKAEAFQDVNTAFADLIASDVTALPAQERKLFGPTAKNAFIEQNKISFNTDGVITESERWSLKTGSVAYIGKHESESRLVDFATENLLQLKNTAAKFAAKKLAPAFNNFHFTLLVTDTPKGSEDKIIAISEKAAKAADVHFSNVPTNAFGMVLPIKIADYVKKIGKELKQTIPSWLPDTSKEARLTKALEIGALVEAAPQSIGIDGCASGQDRTGVKKRLQKEAWAIKTYSSHGITMSRNAMEREYAHGYHEASLASLPAPGSTGIKTDSIPGDYSAKEIIAIYHRKTAKTNKLPPINEDVVKTLHVNKDMLKKQHKTCIEKISETTDPKEILRALSQWAELAVRYQLGKEFHGTASHVFRIFTKNANPKETKEIRDTMTKLAASVAEAKDQYPEAEIQKIQDLLSQTKTTIPNDKKRGTVFKQLDELVASAAKALDLKTEASITAPSTPKSQH